MVPRRGKREERRYGFIKLGRARDRRLAHRREVLSGYNYGERATVKTEIAKLLIRQGLARKLANAVDGLTAAT
jgi:hypothetical protein